MATRKGTPREIATQGLSSPDALGISTQGFIEPVLGDIITGGEAGVIYVQGSIGAGGIVTGGGAGWTTTWAYAGSGGLTLGGTAGLTVIVIPSVGGDLVSGGGATWTVVQTYNSAGSISTAGGSAGWSTTSNYTPDGSDTIITGGAAADVEFGTGVQTGRGGVFHRGRVGIKFEYAEYHQEQTPMDYWKKIEDAIEKAKQREGKLFKYTSKGGLATTPDGRAKVIILHHDLPDSKVIVHSNHEIDDKIKLEITKLFNNDVTADEILDLDDQFVLNDLLNRGDYEIQTGENSRYRYRGKDKGAGGEAGVSFQPASAKVDYFDRKEDQRRKEDEQLVMGEGKSNLSREEEELELLGLLD